MNSDFRKSRLCKILQQKGHEYMTTVKKKLNKIPFYEACFYFMCYDHHNALLRPYNYSYKCNYKIS